MDRASVGRSRWPVLGRVLVGWWLVGEGDLEVDLDSPAGDADLLNDELQQPLAALKVKAVQRGGDLLGELRESAAQPVLGGELGAAVGEGLFLPGELAAAGGVSEDLPGGLGVCASEAPAHHRMQPRRRRAHRALGGCSATLVVRSPARI